MKFHLGPYSVRNVNFCRPTFHNILHNNTIEGRTSLEELLWVRIDFFIIYIYKEFYSIYIKTFFLIRCIQIKIDYIGRDRTKSDLVA